MWSYYLKDNVHISERGEKMSLLRTLVYLIFLSHPRTPPASGSLYPTGQAWSAFWKILARYTHNLKKRRKKKNPIAKDKSRLIQHLYCPQNISTKKRYNQPISKTPLISSYLKQIKLQQNRKQNKTKCLATS